MTTLPAVKEDALARLVILPVLLPDIPFEAGIGYEPPRLEDLRREVPPSEDSPGDTAPLSHTIPPKQPATTTTIGSRRESRFKLV